MKLHTLKPAEGSTKSKKRVGRGQGSGHGGTSTRGHKGAKSRSVVIPMATNETTTMAIIDK